MPFWIAGLVLSLASLAVMPVVGVSALFAGIAVGLVTRCVLWNSDDVFVSGRQMRTFFVVSYATLFSIVMSQSVDFFFATVAYALLFDDTLFYAVAALIKKRKGHHHENV